jgi:hypothetical protein
MTREHLGGRLQATDVGDAQPDMFQPPGIGPGLGGGAVKITL